MKTQNSESSAGAPPLEMPSGASPTPIMQRLREKLKQVRGIKKEIEANEIRKAQSAADLKMVATPGLSIQESRAKILDARLTFDFCEAKDDQLLENLLERRAELLELTRDCAEKFNTRIRSIRIAAVAKLSDGLTESFGREYENHGGAELLENRAYQFNRLAFDTILLMRNPNDRQWSEENRAQMFIHHVNLHAQGFQINLETLEFEKGQEPATRAEARAVEIVQQVLKEAVTPDGKLSAEVLKKHGIKLS